MQNKIRIAMVANDLNIHGISTVIMNYCQNIDLNVFDVTIFSGIPINKNYIYKCEASGISIIALPARKESPKRYYVALNRALSRKDFDIIHVHGNSATITVELFLAWMHGIRIRIAHCHSSNCTHINAHKTLRPFFNILCTHGFACSRVAGQWLFGEKQFFVIPNGINTEKFGFNANEREKKRKELGVTNKFLIGHVGKFINPKNHRFLLKVFELVAKENQDAWLILVGSGPNFEEISRLIDKHLYKDRIIVYGETTQTEGIYSAMDAFVFPSKFEGLGIVLLEAQINGLPCVSSNVVPEEVALGDTLVCLSLTDSPEKWKDAILKHGNAERRELFFERHKEQIEQYDIKKNARHLEKLYKQFLT